MYVSLPAPAEHLQPQDVSADWRYSGGAGHFALDYRMPQGTPLFAVRQGTILDCNDGVVDTTPGRPGNFPWQGGANSPSNWILLRVIFRGRPATIYYQHLFDTKVRKGQKVDAGQLIGLAGQTGNATGNHLHVAAMWGGNYNEYSRYAYMLGNGRYPPPPSGSVCIYKPSLLWSTADLVSFSSVMKARESKKILHDVLQTQKALADVVGLDYSSAPGRWGPRTEAAWHEAGIRSKTTGRERLAWLGLKASRQNGITAIP